MTRICFIDTETTSLRPDRRAWEVGLIVRDPGRPDDEHRWFVRAEDLDLGNADSASLRIGRFYERHPDYDGPADEGSLPESYVMTQVERLTRGAHLVGAVPNFDADVLSARMRANGSVSLCPSWHYHLIDVEALAIGCLAGRGWPLDHWGDPQGETARMFDPRDLPWKSDDLSAALGVTVSDEDRHTALGDAKWAQAIYDAVTGQAAQ